MKETPLLRLVTLLALAASGCIPEGAPATPAPASGSAPGAGAGAGTESAADLAKCPADGVIDDAEDGNNQIAANHGRGGYWYTFADKAGSTVTPAAGGTFTMTPGGASGSAQAARANGKVGTAQVVYAGMGFNFLEPKAPYDARAYRGVAFWAKVGPGSSTKVRVKLPDGSTDPDGKVCTECYNDFGADLELTTTWTRYTLRFAGLSQLGGWGAPHPPGVEASKLYGLQFQANTPGASFDLWVDNLEFTGCH